MNIPSTRISTEWLALAGVGIGLVVALIVDQAMLEGMTDRPVVITAITAIVAMLWLATIRLFIRPAPAPIQVKRKGP